MIDPQAASLFWSKVEKQESCWIWTGALTHNGYGAVQLRAPRRVERAHRVSYQIAKGTLPKGALVLHSCDNRRCVNPEHLSAGTAQANTSDMIARGRQHRPGNLNPERVARIRALRRAGTTLVEIASAVGLHVSTVSRICRRESWAHVSA